MDFIDQIQALATRIRSQLDHVRTEEATKNALVMPFINALGYNVFDPTEVIPEFTADVGVKKGEKVDYAVVKDGKLAILFECKSLHTDLEEAHASQLYRYFSVTEARIAVLTNGVVYRFFSDLDEPNKMDSRPFLEFNILEIHGPVVDELKKLTKSSFDIDQIVDTAGQLKYTREIKKLLGEQLASPSEEFVRFFASKVYSGRLTQSVREQFTNTTKQALRDFINERINERLKSALAQETTDDSEEVSEAEADVTEEPRIVTTEEELEAFHIVKAILRKVVDPRRVAIRDVATYCSIILDDNNRKPLCRLWFNTAQKYLGLFDKEKQEERVPIEDLNAIYDHAERLRATVVLYE